MTGTENGESGFGLVEALKIIASTASVVEMPALSVACLKAAEEIESLRNENSELLEELKLYRQCREFR